MSTTSKVINSVRALDKLLKDTCSDMEPLTRTLVTSKLSMCSNHHCIHVWERRELDVGFREGYLNMQQLGSHDRTFDCDVVDLAIVLSLCLLFSKFRLEPLVMVSMVLKVRILVACRVDSWFCYGGGGGLLGSTFG
jgi:hypothetical protein